MAWPIIAALIVVPLLLLMRGMGVYNRLVTLKTAIANNFSQIEVQLKRRYDLIPNLLESVMGYMTHESGTLEAVVAARFLAVSGLPAAAANPGDPAAMEKLAGAEQGHSGSLGQLFALAETYPDLKANENMIQLSQELTSTENKISSFRPTYNNSVTQYNTYKYQLPPVVLAGTFGFGADAKFLEFDHQAIAEPPKVLFS